ncbi:MAG: hypothetical protein ACLQQ4_16115 [Bacteroidia bacterium]
MKTDVATIKAKLTSFKKKRSLPGINTPATLDCFARHIVDSIKRIQMVTDIRDEIQSPDSIDATRGDFNPIKAATYHKQHGNIDEAFWLVFLATHFGEDEKKTKWRWVQDVYCGLGHGIFWNWKKTSADPNGFRRWLELNKSILMERGEFGNHRKFMSLKDSHTGMAIASYINWIGLKHKHADLINNLQGKFGVTPHELFDTLYKSMTAVFQFGRVGRFDYLSMVGKLGLIDIEPGNPYLLGATGPLTGAYLLFGESKIRVNVLNSDLQALGEHLNLYFGMQVIEDAVCNWQKSPDKYISSFAEGRILTV